MEHSQRIFLLHSLLNSIVSVRVENVERVPRKGGVLLVCNHSDLIDPLVQGLYSGRNLCYLAKAELIDGNPLRRFQRFVDRARRMGVPALVLGILTETLNVSSQLLRDARILPIVRGYRTGSAAGSLKYYDDVIANVVKLLQEGEAVAMYPEGGRSFDGKLKPFRGLAARIAIQAGVPVIPTALVGAYGFSDLNRWVSNRPPANRSIIYRIGEPIYARDLAGIANISDQPEPGKSWRSIQNKDAIKSLTRQLYSAVDELLTMRPRRPRTRRPVAPKTKSAIKKTETLDLFNSSTGAGRETQPNISDSPPVKTAPKSSVRTKRGKAPKNSAANATDETRSKSKKSRKKPTNSGDPMSAPHESI